MTWTFSDETKNGALPVTYTNYYDDNLPPHSAPYAEYSLSLIHILPQPVHSTAAARTAAPIRRSPFLAMTQYIQAPPFFPLIGYVYVEEGKERPCGP